MSFAQEIKDFVSAYSTVSQTLNERDRTDIAERSLASEDAWRRSQIKKNEWDMGKEARENENILEFTRGGTMAPLNSENAYPGTGGATPTATGSYNPAALEQAFADTESFGGDWNARGVWIDRKREDGSTYKDRAYGKYQVMGDNVGPWTEKYFGQALTPEQFLANRDAQQAVFHGEMGRMVAQYGNLQDAMSEWFTGVDYDTAVAQGRRDVNMGVAEYVDRISSAYDKYSAGGQLAAATGVPEAIPTSGPAPSKRVASIIDSGEWFDTEVTPEAAAAATGPSNVTTGNVPDYWDENQIAAVQGVNPDLLAVTKRASEIAGFPIGVNIAEIDDPTHGKIKMQGGMRDQANQQQMVDIGWSKTMNSNHLKGMALDLVPLVNGQPQWDADDAQFEAISQAMKQASKELGIPVEWGGNWKGFRDLPHYQLPKGYKGRQQVAELGTGIDDDINDEAGIGDAADLPNVVPSASVGSEAVMPPGADGRSGRDVAPMPEGGTTAGGGGPRAPVPAPVMATTPEAIPTQPNVSEQLYPGFTPTTRQSVVEAVPTAGPSPELGAMGQRPAPAGPSPELGAMGQRPPPEQPLTPLEEYYYAEEERLGQLEYQLQVMRSRDERDPLIPQLEAAIKEGWTRLAEVTSTGVIPEEEAPGPQLPAEPVPNAQLTAMGKNPPPVRIATPRVEPPAEPVPEVEPEPTEEPAAPAPAAVPETAEEAPAPTPARQRGVDPLPQTSGYTDPVSQAGHESLSPHLAGQRAAGQVAQGDAEAVEAAMTDRSTPKATILKGLRAFGRKILGIRDRGAIDTGEEDPAAEADMAGVGGSPATLVQQMEKIIDPNNEMSQEVRQWEVMQTLWNFHYRKGDPDKALGATFSLYQAYKQIAHRQLALAKAAASEGDDTEAIQRFLEYYNYIPDGNILSATANPDGTFVLTLTDEETGETDERTVNSKDIIAQLMNITPDQFDSLVEEKILGAEPESSKPIPGLTESTEELREGGAGEAVPEGGPPPATGDTGAGGADLAIPEETAPVQVASTEPTGPGVMPAAPSLTTPETTIPADTETGEAIPETVETAAGPAAPIETAPTKPMTRDEFTAFRDTKPQDQWPQLEHDWAAMTKVYEDWAKTRPSEANVEAVASYDEWFRQFQEFTQTNPGEVFTPDYNLLAPVKAPAVLNAMRGSVDSYNNTINQQLTQQREAQTLGNTEEDRLREARERETAATSQELRERLEAEARGQPLPTPGGPVIPGPMPAPPPRSGVTLPGPMPADMDVLTPRIPTPVEGEALAPQAIPEWPAAAADLTTEDAGLFRTAYDKEADRIRQENKDRFGTPREPLPKPEDMQGTIDKVTAEQLRFFEAGKLNAADNPDALASLTNLETNIGKYGLDSLIQAASAEVARTGGDINAGITSEIAAQTVLSMLMVPTEDPGTPHYSAAHSLTQPGMVDVTFDGGGDVTMPLSLYQDLDKARRTMAADYINQSGIDRAAAAELGVLKAAEAEANRPAAEQLEEEFTTAPEIPEAAIGVIPEDVAPSTMTPEQRLQWELEHQQ